MKKILFITLLALLLNACGQTGKLTLPAKTTETTVNP
jgi:predicted small lipoprotein YifL